MRRFSILLLSLVIAWFAFAHTAASTEPASFVLRDGILLATLAALLFAAQSVVSRPQSEIRNSSLLLPAILFLFATLLRLWRLSDLPAECIGEECTRALQLAGGEGANGGLVGWLGQAFWQFTQDGVFSLRLASALVGSLSVMAFYGLASQIVAQPATLIGTLLLAVNPWHLWLSRSGDLSGGLILLVILLLWALLALVNQPTRLRALWLALAAVPLLFEFFAFSNPSSPNQTSLLAGLQSLLHSTPNNLASPFAGAPLLMPILSALALCGLAVAVRNGRQKAFAAGVAVTVLLAGLAWFAIVPMSLLLPVIFLLATVALDPLLTALLTTWQPLLPRRNLFALAMATFLIVGGSGTVKLLTQVDSLQSTEADAINGIMARYLLQASQAEPQSIFFTPPALRFDPAARLLLGAALQGDQIRTITPSALPLDLPISGDILFMLPPADTELLTLLQQIYPLARVEPQTDEQGVTNFSLVRLSPDAQAARQPMPSIGLTGTYFPGEQPQGIALAQQVDPIPGYPADLPTPYSVLWSGQIAAVRTGEYLLGVLADGTVGMIVDGTQIIANPTDAASDATSVLNQLHEGTIFLERGWHSLEIRYTPSTALAPLSLYWQPPGSNPAPLHSQFLTPSFDPATQPPIFGNMVPLADERLGASDGFALTASVDLWQSVPKAGIFTLPELVAQPVWRTTAGCGAGEGQLNRPHGAIFDANGGQIFVADTDNRRIVAYSFAGQPQRSFTNEAFQEVVDVALEPGGALLALDAMANSIFRIDPATNTTTPFATDASFYRPRGFSVDPLGMILVADTGGARVVVLNPEGFVLGEFGGLDQALGTGQPADALALNNVWWAFSAENGRLWNLGTLGSLGALSYNNTIDGPQMAVLPNGSFFVSDPGKQRVLYFVPTGQPIRQLSGQHSVPTGVAAAVIEGQTYLAVVDTQACSLTLWRVLEL